MKKYLLVFYTIILVVIDQAIKWWMMKYHPSFVFENRGIIFGFINNQVIGYGLLVMGFGVLFWLIYKTNLSDIIYLIAISLITAGAVSNLIDRISFGYVIDYSNFYNLNHYNLADIYILLGVLIYIFQVFRKNNK